MENLIGGKDVYQALADGKEVEVYYGASWRDVFGITIHTINTGEHKFRLKPQTIKIGNIDVPAPFRPEIGDEYYIIDASVKCGYSRDDMTYEFDSRWTQFGAWRSESEIKQVVAVLRNLFNDQLYKDE